MPYVKSNALTPGTNAVADDLDENYEDARRYINRDIVKADLAEDSVDFPEIVRGEYSQVTGLHQFTLGHSWGKFRDRKLRNINPLCGRVKNEAQDVQEDQSNAQVITGENHIITMWQTVPDTAIQIDLEQAALVTYRAWIEVQIPENYSEQPHPPNDVAQHRWTSFTALRDATKSVAEDPVPLEDISLGRHFDETVYSSLGGTVSSWGGPIAQDPMRDTTAGNGFAANISAIYYRRMYCITKTFELNAGLHNFGLLVDAHHDNGMFWTHNVVVEVEYV